MNRLRSRRQFLADGGRVALAAAWIGLELSDAGRLTAATVSAAVAPPSTANAFLRVQLQAARLEAMESFYRDTLGFGEVARSGPRLTVRTGKTVLEFEAATGDAVPYYHVAWAIPENQFPAAKHWLAERTPLLRARDGRDEFHFRARNRHAVYFADPTGNILELIARHNLDDGVEGPFGVERILYVNHVGLVMEDVPAAIREIQGGLGLELAAEPIDTFAQLGDEHRHIVVVRRERLWLPEAKQPAGVFETHLTLHGSPPREHGFEGYPYRVAIRES